MEAPRVRGPRADGRSGGIRRRARNRPQVVEAQVSRGNAVKATGHALPRGHLAGVGACDKAAHLSTGRLGVLCRAGEEINAWGRGLGTRMTGNIDIVLLWIWMNDKRIGPTWVTKNVVIDF